MKENGIWGRLASNMEPLAGWVHEQGKDERIIGSIGALLAHIVSLLEKQKGISSG